jgi:hypothetical protein
MLKLGLFGRIILREIKAMTVLPFYLTKICMPKEMHPSYMNSEHWQCNRCHEVDIFTILKYWRKREKKN